MPIVRIVESTCACNIAEWRVADYVFLQGISKLIADQLTDRQRVFAVEIFRGIDVDCSGQLNHKVLYFSRLLPLSVTILVVKGDRMSLSGYRSWIYCFL